MVVLQWKFPLISWVMVESVFSLLPTKTLFGVHQLLFLSHLANVELNFHIWRGLALYADAYFYVNVWIFLFWWLNISGCKRVKFDVAKMPELLFDSFFFCSFRWRFSGIICCFIFYRSDKTKDQMVLDLTLDSTIMLLGGVILGTLSVGILGYAAVRYTFYLFFNPKLYSR